MSRSFSTIKIQKKKKCGMNNHFGQETKEGNKILYDFLNFGKLLSKGYGNDFDREVIHLMAKDSS